MDRAKVRADLRMILSTIMSGEIAAEIPDSDLLLSVAATATLRLEDIEARLDQVEARLDGLADTVAALQRLAANADRETTKREEAQ